MKHILIAVACMLCLKVQNVHSSTTNIHRKNLIPDSAVKSIEIGEKCPDFTVNNISNTSLKKIRLSDYKGKLVILDFWATWCSPCVATMPKNIQLQQKFKDRIQFLLVSEQKKELLTSFFDKIKRIQGVDVSIPSVYEDKLLNKYFPHTAIPHYVWINQKGTVIAITEYFDVTEANIEKAITSDISLPGKADRADRTDVDQNEPFFMEKLVKPIFVHNGKYKDVPYKSMLTGHIAQMSEGNTTHWTGRTLAVMQPIFNLYMDAYSYSLQNHLDGVYKNRVVLEVKQPELYITPTDPSQVSAWMEQHSFTYDVTFPDYYAGPVLAKGQDSIRKYANEVMKKDLDNWTGLHSSVEKRTVQCIVLKCTDTTKINSTIAFEKGDTEFGDFGGILTANHFYPLIRALKFFLQLQEPFIDETNYTGKLNIKIDAKMSHFDDVSSELKKFGLQLVKEPRTIDMIVIRDRK